MYPDFLFKNEGAFSQKELEVLANARIANAGLGANGASVMRQAGLGIGSGTYGWIKGADPDLFEESNANRQPLALQSTLGKNKTEIVGSYVRDKCPSIHWKGYNEGVTLENLAGFLDGADVVVDAIDYSAVRVKLELHKKAREMEIPIVAGFLVDKGAVGYVFQPGGVSFEEYFAFPSDPELRKTWLLPASRIVPFPHTKEHQLRNFSIIAGLRHISSNSLSCDSFSLLTNHLVTSVILGHDTPSIPSVAYIDPSQYSMGIVDAGFAIKEQKESIWTRISPIYDKVMMPSSGRTVYAEVLEKVCEDLAGCKKVLEGGVGTGLIAANLAKKGVEVYGVDLNLGMLAYAFKRMAQAKAAGEKLYIGEGDVENLFFQDEMFDGYYSNNVVFDADITKTLREAYRVLKKGGKLVLTSSMKVPDLAVLGGTEERLVSLGLDRATAQEFIQCQIEMQQKRALKLGFQAHGLEKVLSLLEQTYFHEIKRIDSVYNGTNFYIVARKSF